MRSSKVFLTWIFLASTAVCLRPVERWNFALEPRDALLNKRQDVSTTSDATAPSITDTATPVATTDLQATSEAVSTSSDAPTTDLTSTTAPASTSQAPSSSTNSAVQTASSVPLLFTESASASTSRAPVTVTVTPTAVSDTNVPFFESKYHQMIIALACLAGALLIAMIVLGIIALRARADVDLLHDRLSRYEEGFDLPPRKGEAGAGYGRLSLSDPDEMKSVRSRRTTSESGISTLPLKHERRLSGTPMGSGTPAGNRRVAFGSEGHSPNGTETVSSLPPILNNTSKGDALLPKLAGDRTSTSSLGLSTQNPPIQNVFPSSQPGAPRVLRQSSGPRPNLGSHRVSLVDKRVVLPQGFPSQQIRRLPNAPTSNSSHETRLDPFVGGPPPN